MSEQSLFQLGMDLELRSSTALAEAYDPAPYHKGADVSETERKDYFIQRDGVTFAGTHLIVDLWEAERIDDIDHIDATLRECVEAAGATLLHLHLHHFTPNDGVSGVAVLSESHISIHSWPEIGYAALDIFMCGAAEPFKAVEVLRRNFSPKRVDVGEHLRGQMR